MEYLLSITLWNVGILAALLALQPVVRFVKTGPAYAVSNFDNRIKEGVFARRLAMVRSNQLEALALWITVVLCAVTVAPEIAHPHLPLIATVFLAARLSYVVITLAGIPALRSAAWIIGFAAWAYLFWLVAFSAS
ncbi:MAG: MAPEG family protein [Pseudomonadota bacterium]